MPDMRQKARKSFAYVVIGLFLVVNTLFVPSVSNVHAASLSGDPNSAATFGLSSLEVANNNETSPTVSGNGGEASISNQTATTTGSITENVLIDNNTNKQVTTPTVTVTNRCTGSEDSFTATTPDTDVDRMYVYKEQDVKPSSLVAVAPVVNDKTDDVYIGDNVFSTLYLVAQDSFGNRSAVVPIATDIVAPAIPQLNLNRNNQTLSANWPAVNDATSYLLRWRVVGDATWQERPTSNTQETIIIDPQKT